VTIKRLCSRENPAEILCESRVMNYNTETAFRESGRPVRRFKQDELYNEYEKQLRSDSL